MIHVYRVPSVSGRYSIFQAIGALERFIFAYNGTIVFVSHDKEFIKNVADLQFNIFEQKINQK